MSSSGVKNDDGVESHEKRRYEWLNKKSSYLPSVLLV